MPSNPGWDRKIFEKYCGRLTQFTERYKLPMPAVEREGRLIPGCDLDPELGVGHYGVVYATEEKGIVFKTTTDETEAYFVAEAIKLRETGKADPDGIVKYYAIRALPEKHKGRNVYILWREEAVSVGLPVYPGATGYDRRSMTEFQRFLMAFKNCAHEAKAIAQKKRKDLSEGYWDWVKRRLSDDILNKMSDQYSEIEHVREYDPYGVKLSTNLMRRYKGQPDLRFSWLVECCEQLAYELINANQYATLIGGALKEYLEAGLLLADVHANNVGEVERDGYTGTIFVITDPGHVIGFRKSLFQIGVEIL